VLLRHYPALAPALYGKNAFGQWNDVLKQPQLAGA